VSIPEAEPPLGFKPSLYGGTVPSMAEATGIEPVRDQARLRVSNPTHCHSVTLPELRRQDSNLHVTGLQPAASPSSHSAVTLVGLEPTLSFENQGLSLACLPFHHRAVKRVPKDQRG
jgi:hypothetical protein